VIEDKEFEKVKDLKDIPKYFTDDISKVLQGEGHTKIEFFDAKKAEKVVEHSIDLYNRTS
jgi:inorganic pyrophosphatase